MALFSLKRVIADTDLPAWGIEDAHGRPVTLPHMRMITASQLMRVMRGEIVEVLTEVDVDSAFVEQIADLPGHALRTLVHEWMAHSDIELPDAAGKSPTSPPSSTSTAASSKRTSRSGASTGRR